MWILPLIGYVGLLIGLCFLVLSIASGLYYLSELVEEHTVISKKLLTGLIYSIISFQTLLWVIDGLPFGPSALSIISHLIYLQNLRRFPIVKLSDPIFIISCILVLVNHYAWFQHFSRAPPIPLTRMSPPRSRYAAPPPTPSFTEIAAFFGICVWLLPFALFISLSAAENVLPSMGSEYATGDGGGFAAASGAGKSRGAGLAKSVVDSVRAWVGETGEVLGVWRGENTRRLRQV